MKFQRKILPLFAALAAAGIALSGCSGSADAIAGSGGASSAASQGEWPRTITHEAGTTVIPAQPKNIASTSLSATGTLLAIEAPVTSSAATNPSDVTDSQGFFPSGRMWPRSTTLACFTRIWSLTLKPWLPQPRT